MKAREARILFCRLQCSCGDERARRARFFLSEYGCHAETKGERCDARSFAWCRPSTGEIYLAKRALSLRNEQVLGLLLHELGHVCDPLWRFPGSERRADAIAERLFGYPIRYDADDIQTVGRGAYPRPLHLPR